MDEPPAALGLLEIASEATEALEEYGQRTTEYLHGLHEQMQTMLSMLTDTLADILGRSDASVARLHAIEQQIERASELDDMRALSSSLQSCLMALRKRAPRRSRRRVRRHSTCENR